jgi:hypothetical protein
MRDGFRWVTTFLKFFPRDAELPLRDFGNRL